jgi:hypothetical protein
MLGLSRQRVYQLVALGRLPARKVGARVWISLAAVQDRLAGQQRLASNQCVTTQEVADFFGVNERTVRGWHDDGSLPATAINNQLCFAPADVAAFVPPYSAGGSGRTPRRTATRMINGRHYPLPGDKRHEA